MRHSLCGLAVLTALAGVWSCGGDPTEPLREGEKIIADPSAIFVDQGTTKFVVVQLVDGNGDALGADIQAQNIGAGITVEKDPTYLATTNGERVPTSTRFIVGGVDPTPASFEVAAGSATLTVPVKVVPVASIPLATVSSTGPNASDPTVLTVPAPFQFFPDSTVTFDTGVGIVIDRAADGSSITVLPPPGTTTTGTAVIRANYIPDVPLTTTTDIPLTISTTVPAMAGTDNPATAPEITIPAAGASGGFFDAGSFGATTCGDNSGAPCQLYKIVLPADATFDVDLTWNSTDDLGVFFMSADGTTDTDQSCDDNGNGAEGQPEHCTISLPAGTYLVGIVGFGPFYDPVEPEPTWVALAISTPPAE